jgi:thymidylate kinase
MDRFHHSALVYDPVTRGRNCLEPWHVRVIEAHLMMVGSLSIVVVASDEWLTRAWESKKRDEMFTLEQVLEVNRRYRTLQQDHPDCIIDMVHDVSTEGYLADNDVAINDILMAWARRLGEIQAFTGNFHDSCKENVYGG